MGSDIPQVAAELAKHLGTPGISLESALLATHKYNMKCRFRDCGIPVPWFSLVAVCPKSWPPLPQNWAIPW